MPKGKKKGKGKGKGKGKDKDKGKGKDKGKKGGSGADNDSKKLLKVYEKNCGLTNSQMCPGIRSLLKAAAEDDKVVTKFILESVPVEKEGDMPVLFDPFIMSLRHERYKHVQDIHIWDYPMGHENVASLSLFLEKPYYPIRLLELMDCIIPAPSVRRLAQALPCCDMLTTLVLDYNEFGDEGCKYLCAGLERNYTLLSLSLCYCDLNIPSGSVLGHILSTTALRDLFLDGNELQCEGVTELIKLCVDQSETEAYQREEDAKRKAEEEALQAEKEKIYHYEVTTGETSGSEKESKGSGKKKKKKGKGKKKGKKKKEPAGPPPVGPWVRKLHLADNGIDGYGDGGSFAPVICMRLFRKLVMNSSFLEELDLEDNHIGELGGRQLMEGLEFRKEAKLGGVKVRTSHQMTTDTFNTIVKLGSGLKKKGKKKGKKGKKVA
ncbi:NACHT lrr and pyd domains-containing protein 9 [Plakobranchus ocellatus]|uniref:NACHT lrr and pyd domains-containing protein 9 n=1 Tax=Plakobranchus ocellatus TaxID=259542 RepID=A0AAV3ZIQ2_9GAST|nr:NACHT lrr and pyd domains-containing protein 9 [Plakobranchus ocellatus]